MQILTSTIKTKSRLTNVISKKECFREVSIGKAIEHKKSIQKVFF